jgi:hypothetical protein
MTGARIRAAAVTGFLLSSILAFSQNEATFRFPFVSLLTAENAGYQIKLSWRDSPDKVFRYVVYRYLQEISSVNLGQALVVGQVDPGVQYFIDTPPDEKGYFYAVLAQDPQGEIYSTLIPFRNKTLAAVAVTTPATEAQLAARISNIHAAPASAQNAITVTFDSSSATRDLLLFRSTGPVTNAEDLLRLGSAVELDAGTTKVDIPALPGVDYWFTVLDAVLYKLGTVPLAAGTNTTSDPVQIPIAASTSTLAPWSVNRRVLPLPSIEITYGIQTGKPLPGSPFAGPPPFRSISDQTQKALSILLASVSQAQQKQPSRTVLSAEATPSPDKDETALQEIVKSPFSSGDSEASEAQLLDFLSLKRPADVRARAHFYLGQTYFFSGRPRDALLEFLLADSSYYHDVEQWKDACFRELEKEHN